jgi:hypothetical protein
MKWNENENHDHDNQHQICNIKLKPKKQFLRRKKKRSWRDQVEIKSSKMIISEIKWKRNTCCWDLAQRKLLGLKLFKSLFHVVEVYRVLKTRCFHDVFHWWLSWWHGKCRSNHDKNQDYQMKNIMILNIII